MSNSSYYENKELWGRDYLTRLQKHVIIYVEHLCADLPSGSRVADLGCGDGILIKEIISKFPSLEGYGIDFSEEALKHVKAPLQSVQADLERLPFEDDYFDFCFCIDVLEHIPPSNLQKVVDEIHRVCKGPVLLVSPYLESDAIQTVCPHCSATFSPYYHVNKFTLTKWKELVEVQLQKRDFRFVPMGNLKSNIPYGIGSSLVASGVSAIHQHDTICPQCEYKFRNEEISGAENITTIFSPFTSRNRNMFGCIYEEMGIVTFPTKTNNETGMTTNNSILLTSKIISEHTNPAKLLFKSIYDIDFSEQDAVLNGIDLFRSPAYVLNNGEIAVSGDGGSRFLSWKKDKPTSNLALKLVLPPNSQSEEIKLAVRFTANRKGMLSALLYSIPPYPQLNITEVYVDTPGKETILTINIGQNDKHLTPYGLLIDLIWADESEEDAEIIIYEVADLQIEKYAIEITPNTEVSVPEVTAQHQCLFMSSSEQDTSLIYQAKENCFDMTSHLLDRSANELNAIRLFEPVEHSSQRKEIFSALTNEIVNLSSKLTNMEDIALLEEDLKKQVQDLKSQMQSLESAIINEKRARLEWETEKAKLSNEIFGLKSNLEIRNLEVEYLRKQVESEKKTKALKWFKKG